MKYVSNVVKQLMAWVGRGVILLGFAAGVVLLMLWLAGKFSPKVAETTNSGQSQASALDDQVASVRLIRLPLFESAVGTIRAVHETTIGSKLLARVVEVNLKAGQKVKAGDILVRLDDTDLRAKFQQAKAAVASIEAVHAQAAADEKRYASLIESHAISRQDYEKAATALRSAEADLQRAQETVNEVQATLDWATVRSPFDGTVIDKKVDTGDMVTPGQMLVTLFDPKRMQLVASVRESLTHKLQVGQSIGVRIDGLNKQCSGTVSEIVPEAQSSSRAFQVKVTGPCPDRHLLGHVWPNCDSSGRRASHDHPPTSSAKSRPTGTRPGNRKGPFRSTCNPNGTKSRRRERRKWTGVTRPSGSPFGLASGRTGHVARRIKARTRRTELPRSAFHVAIIAGGWP